MLSRQRMTVIFTLLALVLGMIACGGQPAEEPGEEPEAPAEEPQPDTSEPQPEAPAEPVEPEPETPEQQPEDQLVGNIRLTGDDFQWDPEAVTQDTAGYWWTVTVHNDTTETLDITVKFDLLDENDAVVKSHTKTVRLAPATQEVIRETGLSMSFDDANRVIGFLADYNYEVVSS